MHDLKIEDCHFYHSMDLPGAGTVVGGWDLRGRFDDYVGHTNLADQSVLDVGTASGFLSFEAEKRGARVTSFDAESGTIFQFLPSKDSMTPEEAEDRHRQVRNGYKFAHAAYKSRAKLVLGDANGLSSFVEPHDIVLLGQILVHQRDPLGVIQQAAKVATKRIIITEGSYHADDHPQARFIGSRDVWYAWWHLSDALYRDWLDVLGFDLTSITKASYICADAGTQSELWTFVADRRA